MPRKAISSATHLTTARNREQTSTKASTLCCSVFPFGSCCRLNKLYCFSKHLSPTLTQARRFMAVLRTPAGRDHWGTRPGLSVVDSGCGQGRCGKARREWGVERKRRQEGMGRKPLGRGTKQGEGCELNSLVHSVSSSNLSTGSERSWSTTTTLTSTSRRKVGEDEIERRR